MIQQPKYYIRDLLKKREGFEYPQPVTYCNDVKLDYNTICDFKNIFGVDYKAVSKESFYFNKAVNGLNNDSDLWSNEKVKEQSFNVIYDYVINGGGKSHSSITPLSPFEIFMLNDGFKMNYFCELNTLNPMSRKYQKEDLIIRICFGVIVNKRKVNFYFETSKSNKIFQVSNSKEDYNKAINGKLKEL